MHASVRSSAFAAAGLVLLGPGSIAAIADTIHVCSHGIAHCLPTQFAEKEQPQRPRKRRPISRTALARLLSAQELRVNEYDYELGTDHYQVGLKAVSEQRIATAIDAFQKALRVDPHNAKARLCLSLIYDAQGRRDEAVTEANKAIFTHPTIKLCNSFKATFSKQLSVETVNYLSDLVTLIVDSKQDAWCLVADKNTKVHPLVIGGREFQKGLGTHANSAIVFDISGRGYDFFDSWIGLDDEAFYPQNPKMPSASFRVLLDHKLVFHSGVFRRGERAYLHIPITGARTLTLAVDDAGDGNSFDMANWADARVLSRWLQPPEAAEQAMQREDANTIDQYKRMTDNDLKDVNFRNELGLIYMRKGDRQAARAEFAVIVSDDPSFAPGYTNTALSYEMEDDFEAARPFWETRAGLRVGNKWDTKAREAADVGPIAHPELLRKMPEVYARDASQEQVLRYRTLLAQLPKDAQRWILGIGQFMEDHRVDHCEQQLGEFLATVKDPLIYLTSPRIMAGVESDDLQWARNWKPRKGRYCYLDRDVKELRRARLISRSVIRRLRSFMCLAEKDFEVKKGLYLMAHCGHAPRGLFHWRRGPSQNTQLLVLCELLKRGIPDGEERLATAAALDYGAYMTVTDEYNWPGLVEFLHRRLDFLRATTKLLQKQGGKWDPKTYSLEADIGLLWPGVCVTADPFGHSEPLEHLFHDRPMSGAEIEGNIASIETLREMRDHILAEGIFSHEPSLKGFLKLYPHLAPYYSGPIDIAASFAHHDVAQADGINEFRPDYRRMDPNWHWKHVTETGSISGGCLHQGLMCSFLMRSINIATFEQPHMNWYYDPKNNVWKSDIWEGHAQSSAVIQHPWFMKLPWHNFHLIAELETSTRSARDYDDVANIFVIVRDKTKLVEKGIPSGYVLRRITRGP